MGIPKKALRKSQLHFLTAGKAIEDSSHQTFRVEFIEDGITKKGFYKELDPQSHYPELLGKIDVAVSLLKRLFQGKRSAEDRLVYDKEGKLVGTLSLDVEGFKPFNFAKEEIPSDPVEKEKVIPSTETLISENVIELLLGRWFLDDDDGHPHNISLAGDIDFDMFMYWLTILMKEPRIGIGTPKKRINLTVRDWEQFPKVKDSKPYHWATFTHPGQETLPTVIPAQGPILSRVLPKIYADPTQFERLAYEERAHEQKFAAALKVLLTYQPDLIRKRLTEYFGDMTLNYTALDENLRIAYEKEYPELFNEKTNTMRFVDFILGIDKNKPGADKDVNKDHVGIYQKHYDNLYRVVVFYMGCENNGYGVTLPATYSALYQKPSFYKTIEKWVEEQNKTLYADENETLQYNLLELQQRYHQIWRDAYAPSLDELLQQCYKLTNKILYQVSQQAEVAEVKGKKASDDSLTSAWEMIGAMPELSREKIEPLICVDKDSKYREGLLLLVDFTNAFHACAKAYYAKERGELTEEDNLAFANQLIQLHQKYNLPIRQKFANTTSYADEFNLIAAQLEQFSKQVNFQIHLTTTDEQMKKITSSNIVKEILPLTHEEVIKQYHNALFQWAKGLSASEFNLYINEIIDIYYEPTWIGKAVSSRKRTLPVKEFLLVSKEQSGDNRLAYIFSSGQEDTGALNQLLIEHLTPKMLVSHPVPVVRTAVREGTFNKEILTFTKATAEYAKHDKRFIHLKSSEGVKLFYKTLYDWVEALSPTIFNSILESATKEYEANKWAWFTPSRALEVRKYTKSYANQAKILALIILEGDNSSTLSATLFQQLVARMKTEISESEEKQKNQGNILIAQYNYLVDTHIYEEVKKYAEAPTHRPDKTSFNLVH